MSTAGEALPQSQRGVCGAQSSSDVQSTEAAVNTQTCTQVSSEVLTLYVGMLGTGEYGLRAARGGENDACGRETTVKQTPVQTERSGLPRERKKIQTETK